MTFISRILPLDISRKHLGVTAMMVLFLANLSSAATITWSGLGIIDNNWSTSGNWTGGVPTGADDVKFFDPGAVAGVGVVNNTVDIDFTIGSLAYGNTNNNHTTAIASGATLNVTNANGLFVGTPTTASPSTQVVNATVTGTGALVVSNSTANFVVNQGASANGSQRATLDMTGLNTFTGSVRNVFLGSTGAGTVPAANGAAVTGTLLLAKTNVLTAFFSPANVHSTSLGIDVGYNGAGTQGGVDYLYLGQMNTLNVDTMAFGRCKGVGVMTFASAFAGNNPTAVFRGTNGGSTRVTYWTVGDQGPRGSGSGLALGTNDFTAGTLDAMVDTMILGQDPYNGGSSTYYGGASSGNWGVFAFNAGTLDVNTLTLGNIQSTWTNKNPSIGIMRINGNATLKVNTVLQMAFTITNTFPGTASANTYGQLGITNGTALVNSITVATNTTSANNRISLTNATLIVSNALASASYPLTNFFTANSVLGLKITGDAAAKVFVGNLTTSGATNLIQLDATPVFFSSYPTQFALVKFASLNANNFGLTNLPGWATNATLVGNSQSIDLLLPSDPRPVITSQPATYSGSPGDTVNFSVTVSSGSVTPLSYQWYKDGVALVDGATGNGSTVSGATTASVTINNAQPADSASAPGYTVIVTNLYGSANSSAAVLTISAGSIAPTITGPTNLTVIQGSNATFVASVAGNPAPAIQWQRDGVDISGANSSSYTLFNAQYPADDGAVFSIIATNSAGSTTNSATLTVIVPPTINSQPTNLVVTNTQVASFSVTASGVPAPSFQWYFNGSAIASATTATYTINSSGATNIGNYTVVVSNGAGSVTSSVVTLTVLSPMTGAFGPTNGAVNISPDQQLRIIFSGESPRLNTTGTLTVRDASDNSLVQTIDASQFLSYTPGNTSIQTIPNAAIRTVQGSYSGTASGSTTYYYMPIALYGNEAWVTLTNRLAYGHTYYVNCDTGLFLDSTGESFAGITGTNTWRFSTKTSGPATPTASTGPATITIGQDGAGDFATFQGAFDWIPVSNTLARTISVLPGIYRDSATLAGSRNNVTIIGAGSSRTNAQLIYPFVYFAAPNPVFTAGSLRIESSDVTVQNLTLDNIIYGVYHPTGYASSGAAGAFAGAINTLATTGKRIVFDNVLIKGGQDTIYDVIGIVYYHNCEVWGSVDFIYGSALAVFDQCNIVQIRSTGGPCTAPNTSYAQPYGLAFLNCTFPQAYVTNGYPYDVGAATTTFMRPWGKDGMTSVINCSVGSQFNTAGWQTMGNTNETTCRAREYGTMLIGGGSLNVPQIRWDGGAYWANTLDPDYTNNPSLSQTDPLLIPPSGTNNRVVVTVNPSDYTLTNIFGNSYFNLNGWLPTPSITAQPANQSASVGQPVTFTVVATGAPAPSYQWLENGVPIAGATNATFTIASAVRTNAGTYSVIASNSISSVISSNAVLTYIDTAPVAQTMTVMRTAGSGVEIAWVDVATNWSDADLDSVGLNSFSLLTTNGVTLQTNSSSILYTNGPSAADQINYSVTDGFGGITSGSINIVMNPFVAGQSATVAINGNSADLQFNGIPGYSYITQRATNMAAPSWVDISTNTVPSGGTFNVTDTFGDMGGIPASAYYRLKWQP